MREGDELLDYIWSCKCWFCRLFTRRLLRRLLRFELVKAEAEVTRGLVSQGEVDVVKELKELKSAVEDLKRSLVEIKAAISDLTGPFSGFRPVEEAERQVPRARVQEVPLAATAPAGGEEKPVEQVAKPITLEVEKPEKKELRQVLEGISEVLREERARVAGTGLRRALNVLKTMYELRKLYPKSSIESIIRLIDEIKMFTPEEINLLRVAADHVEESLKEGISHEESVLMMFVLLRQLGVRSEDIEEEAIRTVFDVLASKRKKHVTGSSEEGSAKGESGWENLQQ